MLNRREACAIIGSAFIGLPFSGEATHAKLKYHAPEGSILIIENLSHYNFKEFYTIFSRFSGNDSYYADSDEVFYNDYIKNNDYVSIFLENKYKRSYCFINHSQLRIKDKIYHPTNVYGYLNHKNKQISYKRTYDLMANYFDFGEQVLVSP